MNEWMSKPDETWDDMDLTECALWWAGQLGLCAWDVTIEFKQRHELDGAMARCKYNGAYETARIQVAEYRSQDQPVDLEACVVHELLHARFWACDISPSQEADSQAHECAIDRVAHALVRNRRRA